MTVSSEKNAHETKWPREAFRVLKNSSETHKLYHETGVHHCIAVSHPNLAWLVEFCADGKTAHQGLQSKKFQQILFEFGSPIMFCACGKVPGSYVPETWFEGSFSGNKPVSGDYLVMRDGGHVVKVGAVRTCPHTDHERLGETWFSP